MTSKKKWTAEELAILRKNYPQHGLQWDGWQSLLPRRSKRGIYRQAYALGLTGGEGPVPKPKPVAFRGIVNPRVIASKDPYEDYILACMKSGLTPSQVDSKLKWTPGKTVLVLTARWYRLKSGGYFA